jgi:hypothetical protein
MLISETNHHYNLQHYVEIKSFYTILEIWIFNPSFAFHLAMLRPLANFEFVIFVYCFYIYIVRQSINGDDYLSGAARTDKTFLKRVQII